MSLEWALSWHDDALCSPVDAGLFTADVRPSDPNMKRMRRICRDCPVQRQCALQAITDGVPGMWAGVWLYPKGSARSVSLHRLMRKAGVR